MIRKYINNPSVKLHIRQKKFEARDYDVAPLRDCTYGALRKTHRNAESQMEPRTNMMVRGVGTASVGIP